MEIGVNFKKLLSILFLLIFIASCNDYEKLMGPALKIKLADKNPSPVFDGEDEPAMPNPADNDKTVLGIDSNGNGIRDDIDIWINRTGIDYNERMAMRQYARAEQDMLSVCEKELKDEASKVVSNSLSAHGCLSGLSDPVRTKGYSENKIESLTISNSTRRHCLGFYDRSSYVSHAKSTEFHENCNFAIKDLEGVIKSYRKFWGFSE